jgi:pimeloyl-ACP methyl ester carboxylesterase
MADVVANGMKFHVQRLVPKHAIPRTTVVFIHGLIIDNLSSFYYTLAGPVMDAGAEAFLYDLRGHGRSERPPTGYGPDDGVADLAALLDACAIDHPVYLLGNSYGAVVAARMAIVHPERVAGIILVEGHCASSGGSSWAEDMANTLTTGALRLERDDLPQQAFKLRQRKFVRFLRASDALLNGTTIINDLACGGSIEPDDLRRIECPVLAVYGEASELIGATGVLRANVADLTLEIFPGLAHTVLSEATDSLAACTLQWLADRWDERPLSEAIALDRLTPALLAAG